VSVGDAKAARISRLRPSWKPISDEMAHRCSSLAAELLTWPDVTAKSMFGFRAFYRGPLIFAMLPDKRLLEHPTDIAYKLHDLAQPKESQKWSLFSLRDDPSVASAIRTLEKAYSLAKIKKPATPRRLPSN
jgi:hypothetical protein